MIVQRHTGFEEIPQFLPACPGARPASMRSQRDLVKAPADRGELSGRLSDSAQLRLRQRRQGTQVSPEQVGRIGRRSQAASGGTRLKQLAVAHREPDVEARLS